MPYEGEFAGYSPLRRIAETERVKALLRRSRIYDPGSPTTAIAPKPTPEATFPAPDFIVAIDGSWAEVDVKNGYPGAKVGYCTVASVLLNLGQLGELDKTRPIDPTEFRKTEEAATIDAALPGSNVVTTPHHSAQNAFRQALYDILHDAVADEDDPTTLLDTYEALLAHKPTSKGQQCPYETDGCDERVTIGSGVQSCPCPQKKPIYSTDALRIHEGFHDTGSNGELLGEVMQVWERVLLVHLLRCFERRGWMDKMHRLAFILDGPLAVFGHPAWLSAAISAELKRLNAIVRSSTARDLVILGIEKGGAFVAHFEEMDRSETVGEVRFGPRDRALLTDSYIKERVIFSDSPKRYGVDTYFGRKFFYKTKSGARIVASLPFLDDAQDTLASDDIGPYREFATVCHLLDLLVSSRYANALAPIVSAHSHAAIPLGLGAKVLQQLARALMRQE
jgi:hypothetical protein